MISCSFCRAVPEHADKSRDASRLEDGEQALPLVGQVVEDAGCGPRGLQVTCVLHGPHHCCHHLRGLHQRAARCLFACQLVDNLCCLADHHLMRDEGGKEEFILTSGNKRESECPPVKDTFSIIFAFKFVRLTVQKYILLLIKGFKLREVSAL